MSKGEKNTYNCMTKTDHTVAKGKAKIEMSPFS